MGVHETDGLRAYLTTLRRASTKGFFLGGGGVSQSAGESGHVPFRLVTIPSFCTTGRLIYRAQREQPLVHSFHLTLLYPYFAYIVPSATKGYQSYTATASAMHTPHEHP